VDFCRMRLTYESREVSATPGDVRRDVGNGENPEISA
jgi:hypothetical protein